jgi:hypothetical protein
MAMGADDPRDIITIDGKPPINLRISGGVQGDHATAAIMANLIPTLMRARPGLLTMRDVPLVPFWGGRSPSREATSDEHLRVV